MTHERYGITRENIITGLGLWIGKDVIVTNSYEPLIRFANAGGTISVRGTLERHPSEEAYRVVVDRDNYAYFTPDEVLSIAIATKGEQKERQEGFPVIFITWPQERVPSDWEEKVEAIAERGFTPLDPPHALEFETKDDPPAPPPESLN